jgi:hypothetical protein
VVRQGNSDGSGAPYEVYPHCKKSLGTQLSNIFKKLENCIFEYSYLHHQDDVLLALHHVLHHLVVTSQCIIHLVAPALAGLIGRGSGGRTLLSGIAPTVHHPVTQSMPAIKVSFIN